MRRFALTALAVGLSGGTWGVPGPGFVAAQVPPTLESFGQPVYPAYEGWYRNADGSFTFLIGHFNPNLEEHVEIAIGADNRFSPGPEDRGQPTRFAPGRAWGIVSVQVPADFGDDRLTWTLSSNGQSVSVPMHLDPLYVIEPLRDQSNGNEPPTIRFSADSPGHTGPPIGIAHTLTGMVGTPVPLVVWTSDVKPTGPTYKEPWRREVALTIKWHVLRGPGDVSFTDAVQEFEESSDQNPEATATFSTAGEYVLRVVALDETGEGGSGFQCCWTSAHVRVSVF